MAVNAKDFSAAFFHISSLKNETQVTTLPRHNNQIHFGFGKNSLLFNVLKIGIFFITSEDFIFHFHAKFFTKYLGQE